MSAKARSRAGRCCGAATAMMATARSRRDRPRRSAAPCSVTTTSTSWRGQGAYAVQRRHDPRNRFAAGDRGQGHDADTVGGERCAPREIGSASDAADHPAPEHLEIGLAEQIHAHRRVDGDETRERQQSCDGMRRVAACDREVVAIREPGVERLCPEIEAGGVPEGGVEASAVGQEARTVRKHSREKFQSRPVGDQPHERVRHLAEADLKGRAITNEGGDVLRDRGRERRGRPDVVLAQRRIRFGSLCEPGKRQRNRMRQRREARIDHGEHAA
jgi:hypothetical protein